jgi:hypothetical protein
MKKATQILNLTVLQLFLCATGATAQKTYIFFYKPYSDSSETNLYQKTLPRFDFKTQYVNIKNADVKSDFNNATSHKDYRFISISGVGYLCPGLEGGYIKYKVGERVFVVSERKYEKYLKKFKSKVIEGTSDAINVDLPPLQSVAYDYAKAYNMFLLIKIAELEKTNTK